MAIVTISAAMVEIKANSKKSYVYILRKPDLTPFYIGMGAGVRIFEHTRPKALARRSHRSSMIKSLHAAGADVVYDIFEFFEFRTDAGICEKRLIAEIGRVDLGTGPLVNMTAGGDGVLGHSDDLKMRMSESTKRQMRDPTHRAKISARATLRWKSDSVYRNRHAAAMAASMNDPETRKRISDGVRASHCEQRSENMSAAGRARWADPVRRAVYMLQKADPEFRRKLSASKTGQRHSEETKAAIRLIRLGTKQSAETKAKRYRPVEVDGHKFACAMDAAIAIGVSKTTLITWLNTGHRGAKRLQRNI